MIKIIFKYSLFLAFIGIVFVLGLDYYIKQNTKKQLYHKIEAIPKCYTALVLGAKVYANGKLSVVLQDRVETALELYKATKIKRFLLSGDHGKKNYDEVNQMKKYLITRGVQQKDIFLDHAGFDTYNSVYRAKHIFLVDDVIIVSQKFHLKRAIYIANKLGLKSYGIIADKHKYGIAKKMVTREKIANIKAFLEITFHKKPTYLGRQISIKGDSKLSYD